MTDTTLPQTVLRLVGGPDNVEALTHCMVRLRFTLRDPTLADETALLALSDVVMVLHRGGELHVAVRTGVIAAYTQIKALL